MNGGSFRSRCQPASGIHLHLQQGRNRCSDPDVYATRRVFDCVVGQRVEAIPRPTSLWACPGPLRSTASRVGAPGFGADRFAMQCLSGIGRHLNLQLEML